MDELGLPPIGTSSADEIDASIRKRISESVLPARDSATAKAVSDREGESAVSSDIWAWVDEIDDDERRARLREVRDEVRRRLPDWLGRASPRQAEPPQPTDARPLQRPRVVDESGTADPWERRLRRR